MANYIKYSTNAQTRALKMGNFWLGPVNDGKGPTSSTGYYTALNPPSGGFTIYLNKASNGPSIYQASNESQLVSITNQIGGTSFTTSAQCLTWYVTQTDKFCVNREYEGIVTNGLVLNLDAGFTPSYPTSGTSWYDLGPSGKTGTLTNGPTFNSGNGGSIVFDGSDDFATLGNFFNYQSFTINLWVKPGSTQLQYADIIDNTHTGFQNWVCQQDINNTNQYAFGVAGGSGNSSSTGIFTLTSNVWVNLTFTYDGDKVRGYKNGTLFGTGASLGSSINYSNQNFNIGRWGLGGRNWNGQYGIVSCYNRPLTGIEIQQNYNAQKGRFGL